MEFSLVMPLFAPRWITRGVFEGLCFHYQPREFYIITPGENVVGVRELSKGWEKGETRLVVCGEENFFPGQAKTGLLTLDQLKGSLYQPGWFYQQVLKLGAAEGIADLGDQFLVWDSDLLPVDTWPILPDGKPTFALLQHASGGNPKIVKHWKRWTEELLQVPWLENPEATFVPHHMWFSQIVLKDFHHRIHRAFPDAATWQVAMLQSVATHVTFSEYGSYASLAAKHFPDSFAYHPYGKYGETTERFFDDGRQRFSGELARSLGRRCDLPETAPSYRELVDFLTKTYPPESLPSSIAFEANPRHLQKDAATMHLEEVRSRWNARI